MLKIIACIAAPLLLYRLYSRRLLLSFFINAVAGLLCCVLAVIAAPFLNVHLALNPFTAALSALLGPSGALGLLFISTL